MSSQRSWRDGGRPGLILRSGIDRFRSSMFGVPALWLAGALALSQVVTAIDRALEAGDLPSFLDTTVDSARAILGAISSGTIGAASVVFSLTLVAVQLSSSVYSSRVLRTFLRDRFQQHMIGLVLATFLYSLLVLREVRGPLEDSGSAYIPRISVFLAVVLALSAVLALLASISHTAQSLRVSAVTRSLVSEVRTLIENRFPDPSPTAEDRAAENRAAEDRAAEDRAAEDRAAEAAGDDADADGADDQQAGGNGEFSGVSAQGPGIAPSRRMSGGSPSAEEAGEGLGVGVVLTSPESGWLQQISLEALRDAVPEGTTLRLDAVVGSYVAVDVPILTLWPAPHPDEIEEIRDDLRGAFGIGPERTLHQDVAFGITMIEDVAVKALSPGVNDPNTAKAVAVQLGEVILTILSRELPPTVLDIDGRTLFRTSEPSYDDYVDAAFNQIRHYANGQPSVQLVLVQTLLDVADELRRRHRPEVAIEAVTKMLGFVENDLASPDSDPDAARAHEALAG